MEEVRARCACCSRERLRLLGASGRTAGQRVVQKQQRHRDEGMRYRVEEGISPMCDAVLGKAEAREEEGGSDVLDGEANDGR